MLLNSVAMVFLISQSLVFSSKTSWMGKYSCQLKYSTWIKIANKEISKQSQLWGSKSRFYAKKVAFQTGFARMVLVKIKIKPWVSSSKGHVFPRTIMIWRYKFIHVCTCVSSNLPHDAIMMCSPWKWIPSREPTYPTLWKGKSSSNMPCEKDMLVPRKVHLELLSKSK